MRPFFNMVFTLALVGMLGLQSTAIAAKALPECFGVRYDSIDPDHILGTNGDDRIIGNYFSCG